MSRQHLVHAAVSHLVMIGQLDHVSSRGMIGSYINTVGVSYGPINVQVRNLSLEERLNWRTLGLGVGGGGEPIKSQERDSW